MSYGTIQAEKMTTESGYSLGAGNASSFKNRIINGEMDIDQRNAGAVVTPTGGQYTLDRWQAQLSAASKFSVQRSASAPAGFSNSLLVTSLGSYSVTSTDFFTMQHSIEGFNFADFGWGSANAKPATLSFWVRSSLTGTFSGSFRNSAGNRAYPYSYTITAANTWQFVSITVPGDTTGTWVGATNGTGVQIFFDFGSGSVNQGTPGAWANGSFNAATGQTNLLGTNGATFAITGVQLEVGTVATSFDFRSYGTELLLCQRYYEKSYDVNSLPSNLLDTSAGCFAQADATSRLVGATGPAGFRVSKRAIPTVTIYNYGGTAGKVSTPDQANTIGTSVVAGRIAQNGFGQLGDSVASFTVGQWYWFGYTASAEL